MSALRVGLVGAGPWAHVFHAPALAGSPAVDLVGVWARRPEAASALTAKHGGTAFAAYDDLLGACDAVVFSVPPDVQAAMAVTAAAAGKHLLLEKPLGLTLDQAEAVASAVADAGVVSQMVLTNRYLPSVRTFLAEAADFDCHGARAAFIAGGAIEGGFFATPWRVEHGALLDVGPHILDFLDAAVGPIASVSGVGDPTRWVELTCRHENGAISQASLSINTGVDGVRALDLYGPSGSLSYTAPEGTAEFGAAVMTLVEEFATSCATGQSHALDAARGLYLQRLIAQAAGGA